MAPGHFACMLVAVAVGVVPTAAGCGGAHRTARASATTSTSGAVATTTTAQGSVGSSSSVPASTSTTAGPTTTKPVPTTVAIPTGDAGPQQFQLPSGNIGCYVDATQARCDIRDRQWQPPPRPASCPLDYGQGLVLDADGARLVCAGDTTLGGPATLAYGQASRRGALVCISAASGVTCRDVATNHGFSLAREAYQVF